MLNKDAGHRMQLLDVLRAPVMQPYFDALNRPGGVYASLQGRRSARAGTEPIPSNKLQGESENYAQLTPKERIRRKKEEENERQRQALAQAAREAIALKAQTAQRKEEQMRRSGEIPKVKPPPTQVSLLNPMELAGTSFSRASDTMISEQEPFEEVPYTGTVGSMEYSQTGGGAMAYTGGYGGTGTLGYSASKGGTTTNSSGIDIYRRQEQLNFSQQSEGSVLSSSRSLELSTSVRNPDDRVISSSGVYDMENIYEDDFESEDEEDPQPYSMATTGTNPLETLDDTRASQRTMGLQGKIEELRQRCVSKLGMPKFAEIYEFLKEQRRMEVDDDIVRYRQIMQSLEALAGKKFFNECFLIDQIIFLENEGAV